MLALSPQTCGDDGDAALVLWGVMRLLFAVSTAVVGYALLILATFGICALGLLIGFNC